MKIITVLLNLSLTICLFMMLYYIVRILFNYIRHSKEIEIWHPYSIKLFFISIVSLVLQIILYFIS